MTKEKENNMQGSVQTKKEFSMNDLDVMEFFGISQKDKKKKFRYADPDNFYEKYFLEESAADSVTEEKNNYHKSLEEQQKTIYTLTLRFTASEDKVRSITTCFRANGIRIKVLEKEVKEI